MAKMKTKSKMPMKMPVGKMPMEPDADDMAKKMAGGAAAREKRLAGKRL